MPALQPPLFRLADLLLEGGLAEFLTGRRAGGDSWDTIAKKLWLETGQQVDVSGPTVQGWLDRIEAEAAREAS